MRKKLVSVVSLLIVAVSVAILGVFYIEDVFAADGASQTIYASEDTTLVYDRSGNFLDEDGEGVLSVGYMAYYNNTEGQILLKFNLPTISTGYDIESASLYFPVIDADINPMVPFSLKVSTSTNHSWVAGFVNSNTVPKPTIGSTQSISVSDDTRILGPIDITSYIIEESLKTTPKATLILSAFSYADAVASGIVIDNHYINTGEMNGNFDKPRLTITYSKIRNIEITGVENDGIYNKNVTPQFNIGTATLNESAFTSGTPVTVEGSYTLIVTANGKSETVQFTIDKTPPNGSVSINSGAAYTTSQDVTLNFTLGAGVMDVVNIQFSNDGTTWSDAEKYSSIMNYTLPAGDGSKTVYVRFLDHAGNAGPAQDSIMLDMTPPKGTVTILESIFSGTSITKNTVISLAVTSSDAYYMELGEEGYSYGTKVAYNGQTQSYTLQDTEEDGVKTILVRLSDQAGNTTVLKASVTLDRVAPTGTVAVNDGNAFTNKSNVVVEVTPAAGVTDIAYIKYTVIGSASWMIPYSSSFLLNIGSIDGAKAVTIQLIDGAGNESPEYHSSITLDTVKPTGTVVINSGDTYATSQEVTLNFTLGSGVTDVVSVQFSNDDLIWSDEKKYSASMNYTFPVGDGSKTVYVRFIDRAGNVGSAQDNIILDATPPTGAVSISGSSITNATVVSVKVTSSDADFMELGEVGGSYGTKVAYSGSTQSYTLKDIVEDGVKTLQVRLSDLAGNTTVLTTKVTLDRIAPTGTLVVNNGKAFTNKSNAVVELIPTTGVTDIATIKYTINGSAPTMIGYTSSFTVPIGSIDGAKVVTIKLIDGAGNVSPVYNSTVTLDTVEPTGTVVINAGAVYATSQKVTLDFTLGSGVTDVVGVQFSIDNLTWSDEEDYSASMSYILPLGDGSKTVYVRFIDRAGNFGSAQDHIILDMTAPIVHGVTDGESYSSTRTITFNEGNATLNGSSFISGSSVDAEGSYVLVVTDVAGNSITITFNILKYRVSYDGNGAIGGIVPIDSQTYESGNSVSVANNTGSLVQTGFTFKGWNTEADGSGTSYVANDTFNISTANVTLYAMWDVNHYTLSFESNGGSVVATQNKSYNETATEPSVPTKSGYTFAGWYKEITLTNQWIFTKDLVTADMTLYAKWIANSSSGSNGGGYIPTPPPNSTVYFETNGGNSPAPEPSQESEPAPDGSKSELPLSLDDISGHWAQGMIEELASQGIITGYPDGSFHPNESIQRQHMALIFMRAFEFEPTREAVAFSDVSPSHPSYKAITLLQQAGIVDGSNGRFNLNEPVTRAQMAKIVALALKIELGGTSIFQDVPPTHWSYAYITALAELEIVLGDNGKFNPNEPVTRAEFVAMIYRALNLTK